VEPTKLICRPWADLTDLPIPRPPLEDTEFEALLWMASEMLWAMSGRQFSGGCASQVTLQQEAAGCSWVGINWPPLDGANYGWPVPGGRGGGSGRRVVALPDPPVTEVLSVEIDGQPVEYNATLPAGLIYRKGGLYWPVDGTLVVSYRHGIAPPIGGHKAAVLLAIELAKAYTNDPSCQLPQRLQTVTREGVTVGFQDSFESLDKGRTGIWAIDSWIASVNPTGMTRRARVWTPELARARRI
jgi:hypothetical protein